MAAKLKRVRGTQAWYASARGGVEFKVEWPLYLGALALHRRAEVLGDPIAQPDARRAAEHRRRRAHQTAVLGGGEADAALLEPELAGQLADLGDADGRGVPHLREGHGR